MPLRNIKEYLALFFAVIVLSLLSLVSVSALSVVCSAAIIALIGFTTTKYHYVYVALICFVNLTVYILFSTDIIASLSISVPLILCGLTLGISHNIKLPVFKTLTIFTAVYVLSMVCNIKAAEFLSEGQVTIEEAINAISKNYSEALILTNGSQFSVSEINALVSEIISSVLRVMPSVVVIVSIVFALLSFYIFKRLCKILKNDVSYILNFSEWRASKSFFVPFAVIAVVYLFVPSTGYLSDVLINITIIMMFVFFILGLSLIEYKLKQKINKSFVRKIILVGIVFLSFILAGMPFLVLSVLGGFDSLFDYRRGKFFNR